LTEEKDTQVPDPSTRDYVEQSLALMREASILEPLGLQELEAIKEPLEQRFWAGQHFRSEWEMRNSVLTDTKFPTPDAKYWQSVREQGVHFQELVMLCYEQRKSLQLLRIDEASVTELEEKRDLVEEGTTAWTKADARVEIKKIDLERRRFQLVQMRKVAQDRVREVLTWHQIMGELSLKHGIESYEDHQPESYYLRFRNQVAQMDRSGWEGAGVGEVSNLLSLQQMSEKSMQAQEKELSAAEQQRRLHTGQPIAPQTPKPQKADLPKESSKEKKGPKPVNW